MRLRYYKGRSCEFILYGMKPDGDSIKIYNPDKNKFNTLKEIIQFIFNNYDYIHDTLRPTVDYFMVIMSQDPNEVDDNTKNNILHYCASAIFGFDDKYKVSHTSFNFRNTKNSQVILASCDLSDGNLRIDPISKDDKNIPAVEYFSDYCDDEELASFINNLKEKITY